MVGCTVAVDTVPDDELFALYQGLSIQMYRNTLVIICFKDLDVVGCTVSVDRCILI